MHCGTAPFHPRPPYQQSTAWSALTSNRLYGLFSLDHSTSTHIVVCLSTREDKKLHSWQEGFVREGVQQHSDVCPVAGGGRKGGRDWRPKRFDPSAPCCTLCGNFVCPNHGKHYSSVLLALLRQKNHARIMPATPQDASQWLLSYHEMNLTSWPWWSPIPGGDDDS